MTTYRILDCKNGVCIPFGEIDVEEGKTKERMRSSDGDFEARVSAFMVYDEPGKPGRVEIGISAENKTKEQWGKVRGIREIKNKIKLKKK